MSMIERMATAIDLAHWAVSKPPTSRDKAVAALKVMRLPTTEMLKAGAIGSGEDSEAVALGAWEAMIDVALAEPAAEATEKTK